MTQRTNQFNFKDQPGYVLFDTNSQDTFYLTAQSYLPYDIVLFQSNDRLGG